MIIHIAIKFHQDIPNGKLSYGTHKTSIHKKSLQNLIKGMQLQNQSKGRATIFIYDTLSDRHTHCYEVSSRYPKWLSSYGAHKTSQGKNIIKGA